MYAHVTLLAITLASSAATPTSEPAPADPSGPAAANKDPATDPAKEKTATPNPTKKKEKSKFSLRTSLETFVGIGTFVAERHKDDPYYASTLSVAPRYALTDDMAISMRFGASYEWTYLVTPCHDSFGPRATGAPTSDCSDTAQPNGRRGDISDLRFTFSHNNIYSIYGATLYGSSGIAFGTSRASRGARNILTWNASVGVSRKVAFVTPSITFSFSKFFPRSKAPTLDPEDIDDDPIPRAACASFRPTDCITLGGFVANYRWGADLDLSFKTPIKGLTAALGMGYNYSRRFGTGRDALSSPRLDSNGDFVVDGVNEADTTSGYVEVAYSFQDLLEGFSTTVGISSTQPARTFDGQRLRFPFFDFISPANNFTGYYATLAYSL